MKIQIDPQNLKPGQLFDARQKDVSNYGHFDHIFSEYSVDNSTVISKDGRAMPLNLYDFFIEVSHPDLVKHTAKSGTDILAELTPQKCDYMHFGSNLAGEVGELWDNLKGHIFYGKEIDRENLIEELGDLEWYLEGLRQTAGITRQETLDHNIAKLSKRYSKGYSNQAAMDRADKADLPPNPDWGESVRPPISPPIHPRDLK